jgi:hypothetical protein
MDQHPATGPMIYTITYYAGSTPKGGDSCNGSLDRAKDLAIEAVEIGLAKRAEVRDLDKRLLFHFPRTANV